VDGQAGHLASRRLHHAIVRYLTDQGRSRDVVERILTERYGVALTVPDFEALTRGTTRETAESFQEFHAQERLLILQQLEELPPNIHLMGEPIYLVRRLDGMTHPLHPSAPAVSWPSLSPGYIEFMERAFTDPLLEHTQRLILHERAHFLWTKVLSDTFKQRWAETGDWHEDAQSTTGWSTGHTTGFVSAHANAVNPVEDMAESLAYFVISPDMLRSRSLEKYELIRDAVMESNLYLSHIREDLTFEVDNLDPDYIYPGRIESVIVTVDGAAQEDKTVTIQLELNSARQLDLAERAVMRLSSDVGTFVDLHLRPVDVAGQSVMAGSILRGRVVLSKYAESGYWWPGQIAISDVHGNKRFESPSGYGWRMYVNNPLEDTAVPRYVEETAWLDLDPHAERAGHPVQIVSATWRVDENRGMAPGAQACHATLDSREADQYSFAQYGAFDPATGECRVEFVLSEFATGGAYELSQIRMADEAGNRKSVRFVPGRGESPPTVIVATSAPDSRPPTLDLDTIGVSARPVRPEAPDGETIVVLEYYVRDDASGLGRLSFSLRDPQGQEHVHYHYHENFHGLFFEGDPTAWMRYEVSVVLPEGSAPGIWGLSSMRLWDKVGNLHDADFSESLRFEVVE
jgi:hypothetical protein